MKRQPAPRDRAWSAAGTARPSAPLTTYAEDFSLLVRRKRLRVKRGRIRVLS